MKHPEYSKAKNEYQGRNEVPGLSRDARLSFKERMKEFAKRLEEIENRKKY
jgi:hypothetical protein